MTDGRGFVSRVLARVRGLLPDDWRGRAGKLFRETTAVVSDFTKEHIRPQERLEEAPDLAWKAVEGVANEKYAKAMRDYAEEEKQRVETALERRTLESKVRQENATADRLEVESRIAQIKELEARIELFDKLKQLGALPVWDSDGNMRVVRAPKDFNWDKLQDRFLEAPELPKLKEPSESESTKGGEVQG